MVPKRTTRSSRREVLKSIGLGATVLAAPTGFAEAQPLASPRTFVLVHGAWHGGWCWRRVSERLKAAGHTVFSPTLTGLGERSHLLSPDIDLDTHITDIVNVVRWEDLENVVLCGHSYGGLVISGVVEQVSSQVASIVFVDAYLPRDGETGLDIATPRAREGVNLALKTGAISRPPPLAESFNVNARDRAWVDAKMTPQPVAVSLQKIRLTGARERVSRKTYVRAANYASPTFDGCLAFAKASAGWTTYSLPSGHDVMVDMPDRLAEILVEVA